MFNRWVGKIPWRRAWQPIPVFLPEESHGLRTRLATVHRVTESHTTEATERRAMWCDQKNKDKAKNRTGKRLDNDQNKGRKYPKYIENNE